VRPHQRRVEGQDCLPQHAGHTSVDAAQNMVDFLGHEGILLAHVQLAIHQYLQILVVVVEAVAFRFVNNVSAEKKKCLWRQAGEGCMFTLLWWVHPWSYGKCMIGNAGKGRLSPQG